VGLLPSVILAVVMAKPSRPIATAIPSCSAMPDASKRSIARHLGLPVATSTTDSAALRGALATSGLGYNKRAPTQLPYHLGQKFRGTTA
jgi:hypothetical protein